VVKDERIRIQIAFEGGQVVGALVTNAAADQLQAALGRDESVLNLDTDEGTYILSLKKIVYVKRSSRETHIGFGATAAEAV
jgi:hypothetical protein